MQETSVVLDEIAGARLVLAQPHELLVEALASLLESAGFAVAARCTQAGELERCLRAHSPDVALVDADLAPPGALADLVGTIRRALAGGRLVLLVPGLDPALARETLTLEIDGVLLKSACRDDVVAGLRRIAADDAVFPAGWLAAARRVAPRSLEDALSARQREVLELLAEGLPNEAIAERLFISKNTVKFHVAAIYQRLGVRNRVEAARALATTEPRADVEPAPHPSGWAGRPPIAPVPTPTAYSGNRSPARGPTTRHAVSPPTRRP